MLLAPDVFPLFSPLNPYLMKELLHLWRGFYWKINQNGIFVSGFKYNDTIRYGYL